MNYNIISIIENFRSLVGFRNSDDPAIPQLDAVLTTSDSGLSVNSVHSYLTPEVLFAVSPDFTKRIYTTWLVGDPHVVDDLVTLDNINYVCIQDNTGENPETATAYWKVATDFLYSQWVQKIYDETISEFLAKTIVVENLLDSVKMYDIEDTSETLDIDNTKVYGIKVTLLGSEHLQMIINQMGLLFDTDATDLNIYVQNQNDTAATFTIDAKSKRLVWEDVSDVVLNNTLSGDFFIYYKGTDLGTTKPVDGSLQWSKDFSRYALIQSFSATEGTDYNEPDNLDSESSNYGINLNFTIKCDLTEFITQNREIFASSFNLLLGYKFLQVLEANPQVQENRYLLNTDLEQVRSQLYNSEDETVIRKLRRAYAKLERGIGALNSICLPCNEQGYFKVGSY